MDFPSVVAKSHAWFLHIQENESMEQVTKIPISPTLRKLKPGEKAVFPIEQCSSVTAIVSKFRKDMARIGWDADIKSDKNNYTVTVYRTK